MTRVMQTSSKLNLMSKCLAVVGRKHSILTGRDLLKLHLNKLRAGQPSAVTSWGLGDSEKIKSINKSNRKG